VALETTLTSLATLTHASLVQPVLIKALSEKSGRYRNCRQFDLRGQSTSAAKIPTQTAWWGSPADHGASVDTELNTSEASPLGNTQQSSSSVTVTATEFGVQFQLSDAVQEDSVSGIDVYQTITGSMLGAMLLAWESDYMALASSLSQSVGTTNTALSIANMVAAQTRMRTDGVDCDAMEYILDNVAANAIETAFIASNAAAAVDANSMLVCPSTAYNDEQGATTHGMAIKRLPRLRSDASSAIAIGSRTTIMVLDSKVGFGEIQDRAGTYILAKATA
jgi:hypothetical protein